MSQFKTHTLESAPQASKALVEGSIKANGFLPGLHAVMAEAPGLFEGYQVLHKLFSESSFNAEELTVVWQTINVEHECGYCVPAHTGIANMMNVDPLLTEALRSSTAMPSTKLQVLHDTTLAMTRGRGNLSDAQTSAFFEAGYTQQQMLEIVLGLAQKVMSNYTNHIARTPVDSVFEKFAWSK
ncbi:carboxymuconolactone decarboxylase family protein [Alginatibacterium sediminis]|uniref:Carboxymuconolactone decarboxylase family protein n=1 Tax=Alginatibacterium sediminis TaxID=2164068 RepID=A0A420E9S6_9ALTE|nr:carboxymuconolactone decarboxylase family protein [Alginatibacterium sediminis]RKF17429.1 carboxymuconolactone decarboxylase family protein [Alginatibacterium sediminis]